MFLGLLGRQSLAASQFFCGIHGATAILRAAVAWGLFFAAVVEAVVVAKFLAGGNVADGHNPDSVIGFLGLAIGIAGMVDEHGDAVTIDYFGAIANTEEIGDRFVFVAAVGLLFIDDGASVFDHAGAFRDGRGGVTTGGVDEGGANDEAHTYVGSRTWSIAAARARIFLDRGQIAYPNRRENVQNSRYGVFERVASQGCVSGCYAAAVWKWVGVGAAGEPGSSARCSFGKYPEAIVPIVVFHADKDGEVAEFCEDGIQINARH